MVGLLFKLCMRGENTTRNAWLSAGLPDSVPATTLDRQCGSSQQAVYFAAQGVIPRAYDLVVACGIESMSRVPMWSNMPAGADPVGPGVAARFPGGLVPQGTSAELIAAKWSISRSQMDEFATRSHQRAGAAHADGLFAPELAPVRTDAGLVTSVHGSGVPGPPYPAVDEGSV
jgi:acetyl-CoA acyltransferase